MDLDGITTGAMQEALEALLGPETKGLGQVIRGVTFSDGTPVVANEGGIEDGLISRSAA